MNAPENSAEIPDNSAQSSPDNNEELKIFLDHVTKKVLRLLLKHDAYHYRDLPRFLNSKERTKYKTVMDALIKAGAVVKYPSNKPVPQEEIPGYIQLPDHLFVRYTLDADDLICYCEECVTTRWNKFQNQFRFWHRNRFE